MKDFHDLSHELTDHYRRSDQYRDKQRFLAPPEKLQQGIQYLRRWEDLPKHVADPQDVAAIVEGFQARTGVLRPDGVLGQRTLRFMESTHRCDGSGGNFGAPLTAAAMSGPNNPKLNMFIHDLPDVNVGTANTGLPSAEKALRSALAYWQDIPGVLIPFKLVGPDEANVVVTTDQFPGNILAMAHIGPPGVTARQLVLRFDTLETWVTTSNLPGTRFGTVACHELGHILGLEHSERPDQLMSEFYSLDMPYPQEEDRLRMRERWPEE